DEFKTIYLRDLEEVVGNIESLKSIADAKELFREIISALKGFITKHRGTNDSALIGEAEKEIVSLQHEKSVLEEKLKALSGSESKLSHDYESLKKAIEKEKDTNRDAEKDVFRIIARQNEVRAVVNTLSAALTNLNHEEEAFKRDLGEAA